MKNTFAYYSNILDSLLTNNRYFQMYFQSPFSIDCDDYILAHYYEQVPRDVRLSCGVSRGCIAAEGMDEVVKFDLSGYEGTCEYEMNVFAAAAQVGLQHCFAHPRFLGTYRRKVVTWPLDLLMFENDTWDWSEDDYLEAINELGLTDEDMREVEIEIPLYAYERVNSIGYLSMETDDEDENIAASYDSPLLERSEDIAISFVHEYGEAVYVALSEFLAEWEVNDIHCGNVGWINSNFVLLDYAGYHEN